MKNILYRSTVIPYRVVKSPRRQSSQIHITGGSIEVRVPSNKSDKDIEKIINRNKRWMYEVYSEFCERNKQFVQLEESYIRERVRTLASIIEVAPSRTAIKPLKTRWSTVTGSSVITLNARLVKAPKDVIDYIIIQELCKLKIRRHSGRYWELVRKYMPDYEDKMDWLDNNGRFL